MGVAMAIRQSVVISAVVSLFVLILVSPLAGSRQ
jgi:hypothetical protein